MLTGFAIQRDSTTSAQSTQIKMAGGESPSQWTDLLIPTQVRLPSPEFLKVALDPGSVSDLIQARGIQVRGNSLLQILATSILYLDQ